MVQWAEVEPEIAELVVGEICLTHATEDQRVRLNGLENVEQVVKRVGIVLAAAQDAGLRAVKVEFGFRELTVKRLLLEFNHVVLSRLWWSFELRKVLAVEAYMVAGTKE